MSVYSFRTTFVSASGIGSTNTLDIAHGLLKQVYIIAESSGTLFRTTITDDDSDNVISYGFARGEINDMEISVPVKGVYTIAVTSNTNTRFTCKLMVHE